MLHGHAKASAVLSKVGRPAMPCVSRVMVGVWCGAWLAEDLYVSGARGVAQDRVSYGHARRSRGAAARHLTGCVPAQTLLPKIELPFISNSAADNFLPNILVCNIDSFRQN